jgi:hypothetical protein
VPTPTSAPTSPDPTPTSSPSQQSQPVVTPTPTPESTGTGSQSQNGQSGDTNINTGDATNSGTVVTQANTNAVANSGPSAAITDSPSGIQVDNSGNGSNSTNSGSVNIVDNNNSSQINDANVSNSLQLGSQTGNNSASMNTGGNNNIQTGDANVSGTAITAVNTNVDGIMVSEFNVVDDHLGDYVLDFAANCILGCTPGSISSNNAGNGSGSTNSNNVNVTNTDNTFQSNDATVGNTLVLDANSGNNAASYNANGDSSINTGDANVSANALTFANNNIAGNVVYGVVNIYGDLVGDIVFPEEAMGGCCLAGSVDASNSGNGANSTNSNNINNNLADTTVQSNDAIIQNDLILDATTGDNQTTGNTGGTSAIATGDSYIDGSVLNVANSNINGGEWWLVLVNEAGNWVGQIVGAPGSNFAGSSGTQFSVNPNGVITANTGNGANSTNENSVNQDSSTTTTQTNTAVINNTLDLSANTGGNSASYNTGGDSAVQTGDATIIANIVNFVNNNITGGGRLFVTVVNVFGSWVGDFVTPGSTKKTADTPSIGGSEVVLTSTQTTSTPAPTSSPTTTPSANVSSQFLAGVTLKKKTVSTSSGNSNTGSTAQVAGYITDVSSQDLANSPLVAAKKVVKINLAWLLIILPPVGILLWLRRRFSEKTAVVKAS